MKSYVYYENESSQELEHDAPVINMDMLGSLDELPEEFYMDSYFWQSENIDAVTVRQYFNSNDSFTVPEDITYLRNNGRFVVVEYKDIGSD